MLGQKGANACGCICIVGELKAEHPHDLAVNLANLALTTCYLFENPRVLAVRLPFFLSRSSHPLPLLLLATSPSCSGHKTIRVGDLYKLDVVCRKMLRMIVGPRNFVEWNAPWHHSLHHWNGAYEVAHGHSFHKNGQVSVLNKIPAAIDSLYTHCLPQNDGCPSGHDFSG